MRRGTIYLISRGTLYIIIGVVTLISSCKNNSYDTGEGDLSYLHADYTDITIRNGKVTSAVTDEDVTLILPSGITYADSTVRDTVIRRLLYYTMPSATAPITLRKLTSVAVVMPHDTSDVKVMHTDPVKLTSVWLSHNKKYLNMQLGIMMGSSNDSAAKQKLAIIKDSVSTSTCHLSLYHDQAGYEQYYTEDVHLSIPMDSIHADTISISVNTYSGKQVKQFINHY